MKSISKPAYTLIFLLHYSCLSFSQLQHNGGYSNAVFAGGNISLGYLSSTHPFGFSIRFSRSKNLFGKLDSLPASTFGFTYHAGMEYFWGQKDNYDVKYKSYLFLHALGGLIVNTGLKSNISLTAGPSASMYEKSHLWGTGLHLSGNIYFNRHWGLNPSLLYLKLQDISGIWIASVKGSFSF